ncbi:MAG: septal ring lytic transglycosylase RlpA family protein [Gammaproteobacteria bacterium]|nr:septal ring lytic transglycosylase RlpA family protein [Gammaproteobacteria bacterium]
MQASCKLLTGLFLAGSLAACGGSTVRDSGPGSDRIPDLPGNAVPRPEARSKYGNGPVYEVLGKRYTVMPSSSNYQERGVASWYGKKFHGRLTSNREPYDMYAMTAAHKTLPLPTYVKVRNLRNDKSIIVRVNDRGPFVHNRIIDLSYAAALKLDMVRDGTSLVEVTAIDFDAPAGDKPTRIVSTPAVRSTPTQPVPEQDVIVAPASTIEHKIFVQVGAFGDRNNAARRLALLSQSGIDKGFIHEDLNVSPTLFRVRIGPVADVVQYDLLVEELVNLGISDPYLISE